MLYDEAIVTNDTFTFRIQDSYRNTLDNQRYVGSLSGVHPEFIRSSYEARGRLIDD